MKVLLSVQPARKKIFSFSFTQTLLSLILIIGLLGKTFLFYNDLERSIRTASQGNVINYYYDPEVEFLELGHSVNGSRQWNLYGPDRSGIYGGAQGIGGLESCFSENTKSSFGIVNNYFGDAVGLVSSGTFTPYQNALGAYGVMPGSSVNQALQPQWRGHYLDPTGFYYVGARYYDPTSGRFISPDPLGHSSSLGLYDYCNGDPVNGLDPDGRCVEGMVTGQSYNVPSYVGVLMGRMNPFFSTTQQFFSAGEAYSANYETFGESHWNAINATFNPAYIALKGGYEATTGFGMSPNNLGQDLSVGQRIGSGVESAFGVAGTFGIAFGIGGMGTAGAVSEAAEVTVENPVPKNFEFARILTPSQIADIQVGRNPLLSTFYNASDAFVTSSKSLRSGLTRAELARLATIPEENVGGIMRFKVKNGTGLASPINRNIPGFIGHGKTIGELDEFVIPNQPISNFNFSLELPR